MLDTCLQQWVSQHGGGGGSVLKRELLELPYWQLKALMIAAGRLGPLAAEVQQEQQQAAQEAGDDAQLAAHCSTDSDGGRTMATAFISAILQHLTPPVLAGWRADMVVALWWAAARLRLQVRPALLSAGGVALMARMRLQVAAREMPLLVWSAAVLQVLGAFVWRGAGLCGLPLCVCMCSTLAACSTSHTPYVLAHHTLPPLCLPHKQVQDAAFLEVLCGRLAQCAKQLTPTSIASEHACAELRELDCPGALSQNDST